MSGEDVIDRIPPNRIQLCNLPFIVSYWLAVFSRNTNLAVRRQIANGFDSFCLFFFLEDNND